METAVEREKLLSGIFLLFTEGNIGMMLSTVSFCISYLFKGRGEANEAFPKLYIVAEHIDSVLIFFSSRSTLKKKDVPNLMLVKSVRVL